MVTRRRKWKDEKTEPSIHAAISTICTDLPDTARVKSSLSRKVQDKSSVGIETEAAFQALISQPVGSTILQVFQDSLGNVMNVDWEESTFIIILKLRGGKHTLSYHHRSTFKDGSRPKTKDVLLQTWKHDYFSAKDHRLQASKECHN